MSSSEPVTALVTGASSGIGRATAALLASRGYRVLGTCRHPERLAEADRVDGVSYRALDLADPDTLPGFCAAMRAEGVRVGVLVNNAGESQSGPLEELPPAAVERIFRTNVHGPVRLTQQLLPDMRERGHGRVVMVGSMLASFPLAFRSSYVASKAALEAFATAARGELAAYGVWLTTVEPGSVRTGISDRRTNYLEPDSPYDAPMRRMLQRLDRAERRGIPADRVARTVLTAVEAERPRSLYAVGSGAPAVFALRRLAPRRVVERRTARRFGIELP